MLQMMGEIYTYYGVHLNGPYLYRKLAKELTFGYKLQLKKNAGNT